MGRFAESFVFNDLTSISFRENRERLPGASATLPLNFWKTVTDVRRFVKKKSIVLPGAPCLDRARRMRLLTESDMRLA